jgi:D-serine deaminase-like pyridoxal phosphate-dependent protein
MPHRSIDTLATPALLIDGARFDANTERMNRQLERLGVPLRPHLKTVKNIELARRMLAGHPEAATVSTLAEADYFHAAGLSDLTYAVGIAPGRLDAVADRLRSGLRLTLILDHPDTARALVDYARRRSVDFRVLIELDADGDRAGLRPEDQALLDTADILRTGGQGPIGVLVHAGGSYGCRSPEELTAMAERERRVAVDAAERLRANGHAIEVVSVGSTPTALFAEGLDGVTEVRAGVYSCMDLVMAGLGVCTIDAIAISVLTEVIGHRPASNELLIDAGWMALSRDRGTASQGIDQGYGVVRDALGRALDQDLIVRATNQEHGIVAAREGGAIALDRFPIGARLRILPNHACATAAQFDHFDWIENGVLTRLERCRGWQ